MPSPRIPQPGLGAVILPSLKFLLAGELPEQAAAPVPDAKVRAALEALEHGLVGPGAGWEF